MTLASESNPEHLIQSGDRPHRRSSRVRGGEPAGRETMLEALAPYIDSIGIDTTYDLVEEMSPVHA